MSTQALSGVVALSDIQTLNGITAIPSVIPLSALLDETNNPILDESGDYILAD